MVDSMSDLALLEKTTFAPLPRFGIIEVQGQDAKNFLQGQLTVDVRKVTPTNSAFGGYCNLKGRLHAIFTLCMINETTYLLVMPKAIIEHTLQTLKKYAMFSKVRCDNVSDHYSILGLSHTELLPKSIEEASALGLIVCPIPKLRAYVMGKHETIEMFASKLKNEASPIEEPLWIWFDVVNGIPQLDANTLETFLPHNLNFKALNGLSFEKGCYLGQEIIARMEYLGQIKKHLYTATLASPEMPLPGTSVMQGTNAVGEVVMAAHGPETLACLIVLQDEAAKEPITIQDQMARIVTQHPS